MKRLAFLGLMTASAQAVTIEEAKPYPTVAVVNGVTVVSFEDASFALSAVPVEANRFENSFTAETHQELKSKLALGEVVSASDARRTIAGYYEKTAFDPKSIVIRGMQVGSTPSYSIWCSNPSLFGCLEWRGAAGTWVEYEVNGQNRSGGHTGFARTIWMIKGAVKPR